MTAIEAVGTAIGKQHIYMFFPMSLMIECLVIVSIVKQGLYEFNARL